MKTCPIKSSSPIPPKTRTRTPGGSGKAEGLVRSVPVRAYQETPHGVTTNARDAGTQADYGFTTTSYTSNHELKKSNVPKETLK